MELCSGLGVLFGGSIMGAALAVLEHDIGRPVLWASAQFIRAATPGSAVEVTVAAPAEGTRFTQARVTGRLDGADVFHVAATLGRGRDGRSRTWGAPPGVLPPLDCPPRPASPRSRGTIAERIDVRPALAGSGQHPPGRVDSGRAAFWARPVDLDLDASALGLLGDLVPSGIGVTLGERIRAQSLDNTVRILRVVPTEWCLVDVRVQGVDNGVAHGLAHLWSEGGALLATASQTAAVRPAARR
ncbi:acyl-CoA thioesterase [Spinactinospora alkalitolerans]|uniref:Acyl-CoA thioesterase n=1 Tax=Spinactinospora alkalitolerans TaxID=687207 RepID=A0A852TPE0_9ACTN|nr:acyl-CoA thioesterase domain-containing protein [Spinactinospora alkalitolerans]NYE45331.1 acyl-CoA thioesterase [Spinactinospora alkalitolerans]